MGVLPGALTASVDEDRDCARAPMSGKVGADDAPLPDVAAVAYGEDTSGGDGVT